MEPIVKPQYGTIELFFRRLFGLMPKAGPILPMSYGFGGCYDDERCIHGKSDWAQCPICYERNMANTP